MFNNHTHSQFNTWWSKFVFFFKTEEKALRCFSLTLIRQSCWAVSVAWSSLTALSFVVLLQTKPQRLSRTISVSGVYCVWNLSQALVFCIFTHLYMPAKMRHDGYSHVNECLTRDLNLKFRFCCFMLFSYSFMHIILSKTIQDSTTITWTHVLLPYCKRLTDSPSNSPPLVLYYSVLNASVYSRVGRLSPFKCWNILLFWSCCMVGGLRRGKKWWWYIQGYVNVLLLFIALKKNRHS